MGSLPPQTPDGRQIRGPPVLFRQPESGDQRAGHDRSRGWQDISELNQRKSAPIDRAFISLGVFRFGKGDAGFVEIGNRDTDGYVIIDAVQWLQVKESEK
jgi:hypothetical protein